MSAEAAPRGKKIAYQGEPGSNSHMACTQFFPGCEPVACATFEDAFAAISERSVDLGMIAIENSLAGRVADIHHLLPDSGLYIVGEHFFRVRFELLGMPDANVEDINTVHSHVMALGQCRRHIRALGLKTVTVADTAGAARLVSETGDKSMAAIAPPLAGEIYGLKTLQSDFEDENHNTTRFVVMAADPDDAEPDEDKVITSFVFRVRNVPAALYKAMGGFATNGVNITKLESYQVEGSFNATQFYADIEGHPSDRLVRLALEELEFFTSSLKILGVYKADAYRETFR